MYRLLFLLGFPFAKVIAQEQFDQVLFTNGVSFTGKVTAVGGDSISFMHKGERLEYRFAKKKIFRIEFASGRTEVFTSIESGNNNTEEVVYAPTPVATARRPHNSVAVLPFRYNSSKGYNPNMPYTIQQEYYKQARGTGSLYEYQDPSTTNALLLRKGIDVQQLRAYTMDELCAILGVSYIVMGEVTMRSTGASVTQTTTTAPVKPIVGKPTNSTNITTSQASIHENFSTHLEVSIYNDSGKLMYNRGKQSFWNTPDAYKAAIGFVVKRTPL